MPIRPVEGGYEWVRAEASERQRQSGVDYIMVLLSENVASHAEGKGQSERLMELAGKIDAFKDIVDPVAFQRQTREEWTREMSSHRLAD